MDDRRFVTKRINPLGETRWQPTLPNGMRAWKNQQLHLVQNPFYPRYPSKKLTRYPWNIHTLGIAPHRPGNGIGGDFFLGGFNAKSRRHAQSSR